MDDQTIVYFLHFELTEVAGSGEFARTRVFCTKVACLQEAEQDNDVFEAKWW